MSETENLEAVAEGLAAELGCAIVQITFMREKPGWVLRVLIEKPGSDPRTGSGVDLELCSAMSHRLGDVIEAESLIERAYTLEVSSAGVERPLVRPGDYQRFAGRTARFKLREAAGERKRFQAEIIDSNEECVRVAIGKQRTVLEIPYKSIAKANLVFDPAGLKTW